MADQNFPYIVNLCYIFNDRAQVLLQKKARGFGVGKWNGPGGKVEDGETPEQSVIREIEEETSIKLIKLEKAGVIEFIFTVKPESNNYSHIFRAVEWEGKPRNMGEGELKWFDIDKLPLDKMWDDDKYWLPGVLKGGSVHMRFYFDADGIVVKHEDLKY